MYNIIYKYVRICKILNVHYCPAIFWNNIFVYIVYTNNIGILKIMENIKKVVLQKKNELFKEFIIGIRNSYILSWTWVIKKY